MRRDDRKRTEGRLTVVLEEFVLVAALPKDAALFRAHNFPGAEIDDTLVGGVLEENSGGDQGQRW